MLRRILATVVVLAAAWQIPGAFLRWPDDPLRASIGLVLILTAIAIALAALVGRGRGWRAYLRIVALLVGGLVLAALIAIRLYLAGTVLPRVARGDVALRTSLSASVEHLDSLALATGTALAAIVALPKPGSAHENANRQGGRAGLDRPTSARSDGDHADDPDLPNASGAS